VARDAPLIGRPQHEGDEDRAQKTEQNQHRGMNREQAGIPKSVPDTLGPTTGQLPERVTAQQRDAQPRQATTRPTGVFPTGKPGQNGFHVGARVYFK
jgi:hypothetical protein